VVVVVHLVKIMCQGQQLVDQVVVVKVNMIPVQGHLEIPQEHLLHKEILVALAADLMAVAAAVVALVVLVVLDQLLREILEETVVPVLQMT
jgi:hypothetical protein